MNEHRSIIIIGAGLSGLYAAWRLLTKHPDVLILESRNRTGGRILSTPYENRGGVDMGPAWVWPQLQPRLQSLLTRLDIPTFRQITSGEMLYERGPGVVERYRGQSPHTESYRIAGGAQVITDALAALLPESCISLNTRVTALNQAGREIHCVRNEIPSSYTADKIMLALPPRIVRRDIAMSPEVPGLISDTWASIPTWMAAQCKILFIYPAPFWRDQGCSGEVFSHVGPLSEIYDGSPVTEEYYALTSFVSVPAHQRNKITQQQLTDACLAQLQRLFGEASQNPLHIMLKDWSQDADTSTDSDMVGNMQHPHYPEDVPRCFWNGDLVLAGTEVARQHAGYLEGALESADDAISETNIGFRTQ